MNQRSKHEYSKTNVKHAHDLGITKITKDVKASLSLFREIVCIQRCTAQFHLQLIIIRAYFNVQLRSMTIVCCVMLEGIMLEISFLDLFGNKKSWCAAGRNDHGADWTVLSYVHLVRFRPSMVTSSDCPGAPNRNFSLESINHI